MRSASETKLEQLANHLTKAYFPDCQKSPFKMPIRSIEHGPRGGDEINRIEKGKNYGWPVISYGKEYWEPVAVGEATHKDGMEQPVKVYIPSIAPGRLIYYDGKAFPEWPGKLLAGALKLRHINMITLDANGRAVAEDRLLEDLGERVRALLQGPQGRSIFQLTVVRFILQNQRVSLNS